MDVQEAIKTKRAVRRFSQEPIPEEAARAILNAGRRAQSAKNMQPWQFIAVTDRQVLQQAAKLGNFADHLAGAALAIGIITPDPSQRWSILFDAGQAGAYMQLAAWNLGIGSAPATIYDMDGARALLGFPADQFMHIMFSFGYPADPADLTRPNQKGGRAALDEVVHWQHW
jgi:nitroreductase